MFMSSNLSIKGISLVIALLCTLIWSCKEKPSINKPLNEVKVTSQITPEIKELLKFAKITYTDTTTVSHLLQFKLIDENGEIRLSDSEENTKAYRNLIKGKATSVLPIFEIIGSDQVIFVVQNRGNIGNIWAKILLDKKSKETLDISFDHMAESEGYGAGITMGPFENQFVGIVLDTDSNSFGLNQKGKVLIEGVHMIDGISGATITSKATVEMMNQGVQKYRKYLEQQMPHLEALTNTNSIK